jgi:hypothetical protein
MKFEFYLMLIAFSTAVSCAKADKKPEADTTSEGKPAHEVVSKPQSSLPNFEIATRGDLDNLNTAKVRLAELQSDLYGTLDQRDNLFVSDSLKITQDLWAAVFMISNLEIVIAEEGGDSLTDDTSTTLLTAYLVSIRQMNSCIASLENAGTYEPLIEATNIEILNLIAFLKKEIFFKRFRDFDAAGGSIEKLAEVLKVKI